MAALNIVRIRARDAAGNLSPWSRAVVTFAATTPRLPEGFSKQEEWVSGLGSASAFTRGPDGRLFVCEQGGNLRVVKNGALLPQPPNHGWPNRGWPSSEGPVGVTDITGPIYAYKHEAADPEGSGPGGFLQGFAITGAAFYPSSGSFPPAYRNSYYFADYVFGWISRLDLDNPGDAYSFATVDGGPVDMLVGVDGALYVLEQTGSIARISAP